MPAIIAIVRFLSLCLVTMLFLAALPSDHTARTAEGADPVHEYKFHHHEDLTLDLYMWQDEHPDIMELGTIGTSYLGHELWNVQVTNFMSDGDHPIADRPKIYLDGGHHGNEYCGSEITILVLQYLLENYGTDEDATYIVDNANVYITPMINPDGIDLDTRMNARQVDLNRNYPFLWTDSATHGSGPASEREVASNIAFMEKHEFSLYITGHTGILYLIYPWGVWTYPSPDDDMFKAIEEEVEGRWGIPCGQSSTALYPAHGTSEDYGYAMRFAPTWTFEVDSEQFVPVSGERISQRLQPVFECYMYLMRLAIDGKLQPSPEIRDFRVSGDDTDGFTVEYTVNNTGYVPVVNGSAVLSVDGDFNVSYSNFSMGQFNETVITFEVDGDYSGGRELELELNYPRMRVAGAPMLGFADERTVKIGGDEESFLESWYFMPSAFFILLIAAGAALAARARREKKGRD